MAAGQPMPSSGQNAGGGADGPLNHRNINARPVKYATLGAAVVRHVDDALGLGITVFEREIRAQPRL
jgi:hypothetical protein